MCSVECFFDRVPGRVSVVFVNKVPSSVAGHAGWNLWIPVGVKWIKSREVEILQPSTGFLCVGLLHNGSGLHRPLVHAPPL